MPADRVQRICQFEFFVDDITGELGRFRSIASAVGTYIDHQVLHLLFFQGPERLSKKPSQVIPPFERIEGHESRSAGAVELQVAGKEELPAPAGPLAGRVAPASPRLLALSG